MSTEQESTTNQNPDQSVASKNLSDPTIFLTFIEHKFADQRLFSVADFRNEWEKENTDIFSLAAIEENLNTLVSEQKIEKVKCSDTKYVDEDNGVKCNDNDSENSQDVNSLKLFKYDYTYRYKYILPKNSMSEAFFKVRNELLKGPVSISALSKKVLNHDQKIRPIIYVLTCLGIVESSKSSVSAWNQAQENRIRQLKTVYPQLIKLRQANENE